jgi:hypothetical protein
MFGLFGRCLASFAASSTAAPRELPCVLRGFLDAAPAIRAAVFFSIAEASQAKATGPHHAPPRPSSHRKSQLRVTRFNLKEP